MPRKSEEVHNRLIRALVNRYKEEGYTNIKADHINHPNGAPDPVNGYRPDISAQKGSTYLIAEAETCDTIGTQETLDQWRAFDASWKEFHVIVPKRCFEEAEKSARDNLITVDQWWHLDI
jgi:hypothetical protein